MATVSALGSVRQQNNARCSYVLFIDGLAQAYTTDESGELWGSGGSTWIGASETAIGGVESNGARTVKPGLVLPRSLDVAIDPKDGQFITNTLQIRLLDTDDSLSTLFATQGKESDILAQRISPIETAGFSGVPIAGGLTTDIRGRYVGLERIGSASERRLFPALPFTLPGFEHPAWNSDGTQDVPTISPVLISDDPLQFEGRLVTLYRIYKDPAATSGTESSKWYTWDVAYAAGDLVWCGTLGGGGTYDGDRMWTLECRGVGSLLERQLNSNIGSGDDDDWYEIAVQGSIPLTADDRKIGCYFEIRGDGGESADLVYEGNLNGTLSATTLTGLISEIDTFVRNTAAGTGVDMTWTGSDPLNDSVITNTTITGGFPAASVDTSGPEARVAFVLHQDQGPPSNFYRDFIVGHILLSDRALRLLGFERETQHPETQLLVELARDSSTLYFQPVGTTRNIYDSDSPPSPHPFTPPTSDYYDVSFISAHDYQVNGEFFNGGLGEVRPTFAAHRPSSLLLKDGQQQFQVTTPSSLYLEGQLTMDPAASSQVDGADCTDARFFALRGKILKDINEEPEDLNLVARCSWVAGGVYGTVADDGLDNSLFLEKFMDPRIFGYNFKQIDRDVVFTPGSDDFQMEIKPLSTYFANLFWGHQVLKAVLTSTGGGTNGSFDRELADLGLGIPVELCNFDSIDLAYATLPGGLTSPLNQACYSLDQKVPSSDILRSLTEPRALAWSFHGKQIGLFRLGNFSPNDADVIITENDLYGDVGDSGSVVGTQILQATGSLDSVRLSYRGSGGTDGEIEAVVKARDPQARHRRGDLELGVTELGLPASPWYGAPSNMEAVGLEPWFQQFAQLWGVEMAEFFSKRHFIANMKVSRPKGQDMMPGTRVIVTNPWLVNPAGGYGVVAHAGRVLSVRIDPETGASDASILLFAEAANVLPHYAPFLPITSVNGSVLSYPEEWAGWTLNEMHSDRGWVGDTWMPATGQLNVAIYQRTGRAWSLAATSEVASIDTGARTVTLSSSPSLLRDKDKVMVARPMTDQDSDEWPSLVFGTLCSGPGGTFNAGASRGKRFVS